LSRRRVGLAPRGLKHGVFYRLGDAVMAVAFVFSVEAAEAAIEFVGEQIEGFVSIVAFDAGDKVRAADFQVAFSYKLIADGARVIEFDVQAHANKVLVVAEETLGYSLSVSAERRGELEVDAADDYFSGQDFGGGQNFWVFHHPHLTPDRGKRLL